MIDQKRIFSNAARYLGYRKKQMDQDAMELLEQAYDELLQVIEPKHILHQYQVHVADEQFIMGDLPPLTSRDLIRLFRGSTMGYVLLATLGAPLDMRIKKLMITSPAHGAALSSCGSAYIDEYIDEFLAEQELALKSKGLTLSPRFSPGYGDVPLSYQKPLLDLLEARRIGVMLTEGFLMLPEKSVSAVIAVKAHAMEKQKIHRCGECNLENCGYREDAND